MAVDVLGRYDGAFAEHRTLLEPQMLEPVPLRVPMPGVIALSHFWRRMYQELSRR